MADLQNRTLICSVLFIDIVEYSRKPVVEQIQLKDRFNALLSDALKGVAVNDRIILDTGDGAAISFIGDPEDALFVGTGLRDEIASRTPVGGVELSTRMGINLGPVRLVKDINGQPNIIGDGINVAQRVMSFAKPGQVLVSRSYYEVVSRLSDESSKLFSYEGSRTDKHIREHEVYTVGAIPALHRRIDDTVPGWSIATDAGRTLGLQQVSRKAKGFADSVVSRPRLTTAIAVSIILAGAFGTRAYREQPPQRDLTVLPDSPAIDKAQSGAGLTPLRTVEPEPMRGTPEAARAEQSRGFAPPPTVVVRQDAEPVQPKPAASFPSWDSKREAAAEPKSPDAAAEKSLPPPVEAEAALVSLAIAPWGQVYVDGKSRGVSPPLQEIELTPGRHRIELRNSASETHVITVNAKPGERLRIKHKFN